MRDLVSGFWMADVNTYLLFSESLNLSSVKDKGKRSFSVTTYLLLMIISND